MTAQQHHWERICEWLLAGNLERAEREAYLLEREILAHGGRNGIICTKDEIQSLGMVLRAAINTLNSTCEWS
jgi:hypothetical protein